MPDRQGSDYRDEAGHDQLTQLRNDLVVGLGAVLDTERGLLEILTCTGSDGVACSPHRQSLD
ncbi:hypothetical protein GCM10010289_54610 [Streptomyces violascens]|uniref:Uncharacterized protein n=1 Tax=Streptomyces violascens TaxID=67381 RepID=A0ABQ3QV89_9ACTN|nr:hypothetical protein GCM10010289_54610 [Streptomyces violascens]GHI41198.1 hypothetical protein Sviol_56060 [Streptomyces violascens]